MNKLHFGDIYLTRFHPSSGSELKKYRPAVVVSEQVNRIDPRFTLICPFTTVSRTKHSPTELTVTKNPALKKTSTLLAWYLWTVDTNRLETKLGKLSDQDTTKLKSALQKLFT